jgi:hypothetical protein
MDCIARVKGNDVKHCPLCQKVDLNRPALRYWNNKVLGKALTGMVLHFTVVMVMHLYALAMHAADALLKMLIYPQLVDLLLLPLAFLVFAAFTAVKVSITLTPGQGVFAFVLAVAVYGQAGENPSERVRWLLGMCALDCVWAVLDHLLCVWLLRWDHALGTPLEETPKRLKRVVRAALAALVFVAGTKLISLLT